MSDPPIEFGDADPEDAWDDGDPVVIRLALLARVMADIYDEALNRDAVRAGVRKAGIRAAAHRLFAEAMTELES